MSTITIFTDGSSRGNPGPGGFGAIVVHDNEVRELGGREPHTTNNRMELTAAIEALSFLSTLTPNPSTLLIFTDSRYLINGITKWVFGWQKNNWMSSQKQPVENRDLWENLFALTRNFKIEWKYVAGHTGHSANERCDEIATAFADDTSPKLYEGSISDYPIKDFSVSEADASAKKTSSSSRSKAKAYSYLSMVDGKIEKHATWAECEKRVKGVRGALYKKSVSQSDEADIIKSWQKKDE